MYVNKYQVCWQDKFSEPNIWYIKVFAKKKEAQKFAKSKKSKEPYPYILKSVTIRDYFRKDIEVEELPNSQGYKILESYKVIKY